jgi:ABC-type transporter Mla MlaB component
MRYLTSTSTMIFALHGPIARKDIRWMCEHVRFMLETSGLNNLICDVGAVAHPDAGTVEALARMQLTARRHGGRLQLRRACGELRDLLALSGLTDVLPCDELPLEASGQVEEREPPGGVEEERDPADPIA